MFPSVGLICVLENSSIQMQNMPPNNYVCSLPLSPRILAPRILLSPFALFPLRAHCTFTFAFPTYFARLKYEHILYPHARPCVQPEAIQASTFHHAAV